MSNASEEKTLNDKLERRKTGFSPAYEEEFHLFRMIHHSPHRDSDDREERN